jgi:hypothetical protein
MKLFTVGDTIVGRLTNKAYKIIRDFGDTMLLQCQATGVEKLAAKIVLDSETKVFALVFQQ